MFGTSVPVKRKKVEPIKVFRFCILGSPEVGKTSLCTLYNTNHMFSVYKHTTHPKFYCRDFSRRMISLLKEDPDERVVENGEEESATKKKKRRKKKGKKGGNKLLDRYGVQMVDVPGEVHKDVAPNTKEINVLTNQKPNNHERTANEDTSETASLLANRFSDKQNRLHDVVLPHAFIIVFDVNEVRSFEKAVTIARFIRDEPNNVLLTNNPIFFFGNKTDATNSKEDMDRSWAHYQKQIKHLIETVTLDGTEGWTNLEVAFNTQRVGYRSFRVLLEIEDLSGNKNTVYLDDVNLVEWQSAYSKLNSLPVVNDGNKQASFIGFNTTPKSDVKIDLK